MRVTVRKATLDDAAAIARFRWREDSPDTGAQRDAFVQAFAAWLNEHLATHLPFLAEVADDVVGMAWLMVAERVPSPDRRYRRFGDVQSVFVLPDLRGNGIGTSLLDAVLAEARALGLEHVTVHAARRAATLYQRAGFQHGIRWRAWEAQ